MSFGTPGATYPALAVAAVLVALVAALLMGRAALTGQGAERRLWTCVGAGFCLWMLGCAALALGLPDLAYWTVVRPLVIAVLAVPLSLSAVARRPGKDVGLALLDGWPVAGGTVYVVWSAMALQDRVPLRTGFSLADLPAVLVVGFAVLAVTVVAGAASRVRAQGAPIVLACVGGGLAVIGDVVGFVADRAVAGVPFCLAATLIIALASLSGRQKPLVATFADKGEPHRIRLWQLPLPTAVWFFLDPPDTTGQILFLLTLAAALFAQVVIYSREGERLFHDLRDRTRRHDEILRDSRDVIVQCDRQGVIRYVSPASEQVLGDPPEALIGTPLQDRMHAGDFEAGRASFYAGGQVSNHVPAVVRYRARDGRLLQIEWTLNARPDGWVMAGRDVSERAALHAELVRRARDDDLTGLLNRTAFLAELGARLERGDEAAVVLLDLDHFKPVNDTLGQVDGDHLLRRVAGWVRQTAGPQDTVARLGGDEFAVLPAISGRERAEELARALVTAVSGVDAAAVGRPPVSASVGVALGTGVAGVALLRDADLAMYRAKLRGGNCAVTFEPWMSDRVMERSRQRSELAAAVQGGGLAVHLQPVVDLVTRRWDGFEALVRWPDGERMRAPDSFLPLAEETGLIVPMGTWVLREALRLLVAWPDAAAGMAVNVSAQQLAEDAFGDIVLAALAESGIEPHRLTLEITEQAAVQDLGRTASRLEPLRDRGVHVAVDDFGTGYSSLQYLARLPVDVLKIDRRFVSGLGVDAEDDVLVRSMIRLAGDLGLGVVAEGVETEQQAHILHGHSCRLAQGFLWSPARPIADLLRIAPPPVATPLPSSLPLPMPSPMPPVQPGPGRGAVPTGGGPA